MKVPQIILIVLFALDLLIVAHKHGEERPDYNFFITFIDHAIIVGLLLMGGFFK